MTTKTDQKKPLRTPGRPRKLFDKSDRRYQPTKAELEEDLRIPNTTPHELAQAMFGKRSRPTVH